MWVPAPTPSPRVEGLQHSGVGVAALREIDDVRDGRTRSSNVGSILLGVPFAIHLTASLYVDGEFLVMGRHAFEVLPLLSAAGPCGLEAVQSCALPQNLRVPLEPRTTTPRHRHLRT